MLAKILPDSSSAVELVEGFLGDSGFSRIN